MINLTISCCKDILFLRNLCNKSGDWFNLCFQMLDSLQYFSKDQTDFSSSCINIDSFDWEMMCLVSSTLKLFFCFFRTHIISHFDCSKTWFHPLFVMWTWRCSADRQVPRMRYLNIGKCTQFMLPSYRYCKFGPYLEESLCTRMDSAVLNMSCCS